MDPTKLIPNTCMGPALSRRASRGVGLHLLAEPAGSSVAFDDFGEAICPDIGTLSSYAGRAHLTVDAATAWPPVLANSRVP